MTAARRPAPRSALVVPAVTGSRLTRAPQRGADQVVLDLEDAIAADRKDPARAAAVAAVIESGWDGVDVAVRVNGWESSHTWRDVVEVLTGAPGRVGTLVLPKAERPEEVVALDLLVSQVERSTGVAAGSVRLAALVESAAGLLAAQAIAAASPRLSLLVLGPLDLAGDLDVPGDGPDPLPASWREDALRRLVLAGRASAVAVLDGPSFAIDDPQVVSASARRARAAGCDGCWVVHPGQVAPVHAAFLPTPQDLEQARAVIAAMEGEGVKRLGDRMIDAASVKAARAVLARGRSADPRAARPGASGRRG